MNMFWCALQPFPGGLWPNTVHNALFKWNFASTPNLGRYVLKSLREVRRFFNVPSYPVQDAGDGTFFFFKEWVQYLTALTNPKNFIQQIQTIITFLKS